MKHLLFAALLLTFVTASGQRTVKISGKVIDESNEPIEKARIYYANNYSNETFTTETNKMGEYEVILSSYVGYSLNLYIEKVDYFSKGIIVNVIQSDTKIDTSTILRKRALHWYDSKLISELDLGITVRDAIIKFKLDVGSISMIDHPFRVYRGFIAEFADSSNVCFEIEKFVSDSVLSITQIFDSKIIGIRIANTKGEERHLGLTSTGWCCGNQYYDQQFFKRKDE
jgi:hypothetical protein